MLLTCVLVLEMSKLVIKFIDPVIRLLQLVLVLNIIGLLGLEALGKFGVE